MTSAKGLLLAAIAAILWGSAGTAQTFITPETLTPFWVGALRLVFAAVFFSFLSFIGPRASSNLSTTPNSRLSYGVLVVAAGVAMAFFNMLFFTGVKVAGVALGSCIIIGSAPVWAGILETIVFRKKPAPLWIVGVLVAITGGVWMAVSQADSISVSATGFIICLAAGLCYSSYSLLAKELVKRVSPLRASTHTFITAMCVALPAAWIMSGIPVIVTRDLIVVLYLGLIVTGVAYLLYSTALKTVQVSTCVALGLLEPVTAFILAVVVVGENVNGWAAIGLVIILTGLTIVMRSEQQSVKPNNKKDNSNTNGYALDSSV